MGALAKIGLFVMFFAVTSCCRNEKQELVPKEKAVSGVSYVDSLKKELTAQGYQIFDYRDEERDTTFLMQQYFIAFLKSGPNRSQSEEEADSLQVLHMAHLSRMFNEGYTSISGPFGEDGPIRGITIYNVPTLEMADSLANLDPMVKAGRLVVEMHPWWAAKGFSLK